MPRKSLLLSLCLCRRWIKLDEVSLHAQIHWKFCQIHWVRNSMAHATDLPTIVGWVVPWKGQRNRSHLSQILVLLLSFTVRPWVDSSPDPPLPLLGHWDGDGMGDEWPQWLPKSNLKPPSEIECHKTVNWVCWFLFVSRPFCPFVFFSLCIQCSLSVILHHSWPQPVNASSQTTVKHQIPATSTSPNGGDSWSPATYLPKAGTGHSTGCRIST